MTKGNSTRKLLSLIGCMVLIAAMALSFTGCSGSEPATSEPPASSDATVIGEGTTVFNFLVVDRDGKETLFEVHTDKTIVGEALQELGLIDGEEGDYGLYVLTVNGDTLDWDKDGMYWSFYMGEEYSLTGVDKTDIVPGATYTFKAEKG